MTAFDDPLRVAPVRTLVTMPEYTRACVAAWPSVEPSAVTAGALSVLWAQYMIETGGRACWSWNIGNVKAVPGQPYQCLVGTWEGVTREAARVLIMRGQATEDTNPAHRRAVGPGRVAVVFQPPHPATRFRAFGDLSEAMRDHLQLLARRRYRTAWPHVLAGNVDAFARELHARGYYTATPAAYAAGMRPHARAFLASGAFASEAPTMPSLPEAPASRPALIEGGIVHAFPPPVMRRYDDDGTGFRAVDEGAPERPDTA